MTVDLLMLGVFSFLGGLIDAAVGGGGLILIPALLHALPQHAVATVLGTNKLAVLLGTGSSALTFLKRVKIQWRLIIPCLLSAFACAYIGAYSVASIPTHIMKYLVFVLLVAMAVYTFMRKELGQVQQEKTLGTFQILQGYFLGGMIGFYDGAFGPGSGSFFIFMFVRLFGFDFLNAAASSKLLNIGTFIAALSFFVPSGHMLWQLGFYIAACNVMGAIVGTFVALKYGSGLIRKLFLVLLVFLIGRMGMSILTAAA